MARLVLLTVALYALLASPGVAKPSPLRWSKCYEAPFECATVRVPLDYDQPRSERISIALTRLPAADPAHRIGSLFLNPGGPGASGVEMVLREGRNLFTAEVRARFDLIGFDPRGVRRSAPLRCFRSADQWGPYLNDFAFPTTAEQEAQWEAADSFLASACADRAGAIASHMSTANVARDLDQFRAAVGDTRLSYYGVSYGSYLGVTYANLFPERVRALVVDGVVDPIAVATGSGDGMTVPITARQRADLGAARTLEEFFRLCDAGRCAFGPGSAARFATLVERLNAEPVDMTLPNGENVSLDGTSLIGFTLGALGDSSHWEDYAGFLADAEARTSPQTLARRPLRSDEMATRWGRDYANLIEPPPAIMCEDSVNPTSFTAWHAAAANSVGYFGPSWTWASSICAVWPFRDRDRYLGPFNRDTANPLLVVGNQADPSTRYENAQHVTALMPGARLLTLHGWGHTSRYLSRCIDEHLARYMIGQQLPPAGTVCEQDHTPFTP